MEKENCLNQVTYPLSKKGQIVQWVALSILIFLVPMVIPMFISGIFGKTSWIASNSQYVVGTIVNISLIIAGINVKGWKQIIGLITLPSISAIANGFIFKSANIYTVYMIPAIWIGNFVFVYIYRKLSIHNKVNYFLTSIIAILLKVAAIYGFFRILSVAKVIPTGKIFTALNLSMGLNQAITASIAAVICFGIFFYMRKKKDGNY